MNETRHSSRLSLGPVEAHTGSTLPELFNEMVQAVRLRARVLGLCILLFAAVACAISLLQAPFYRASAAISIDPREVDGIDVLQAPTVLIADALVVDSEVEIINSNGLLGQIAATETYQALAHEALEDDEPPPSEAELAVKALELVREGLTVEREARTFVIRITYEADTAERAAATANAIADAYVDSQVTFHLDQAATAGAWIREQLASLEADILRAEADIARFRLENEIPQTNETGPLDQEILENDRQIVAHRSQIASLEADISVARLGLNQIAEGVDVDVEFLAETLDSSVLEALGGRMNMLFDDRAELPDDAGGQNDVAGALITRVSDELNRLISARATAIQIAQDRLASSQEYGRFLQGMRVDMSERQAELNQQLRSLDALRSEDQRLRSRFEATQRSEQYFVSPARVIERAQPPIRAANTSGLLIVLAGLLGGGLVGLAVIYTLEQISDGMRRSADVADALGVPFLGMIPKFSRSELRQAPVLFPEVENRIGAAARRTLCALSFVARWPRSGTTETLRRVLYDAERTAPDGVPVIAVISALRGDGKSCLASNLAFYASQRGRRVLLVDADLQSHALSDGLKPMSDAGERFGDAVEISPCLHFIPADEAPISSERLSMYLERAAGESRHYDVIVLDTPALGYVTSHLDFLDLITAAVASFRWGTSPAGVARRVIGSSPQLASKLIGACLSLAPSQRARSFERIPDIDY